MDNQCIPESFDPRAASCFFFDSYHFDNEIGVATLSYRIDDIVFDEVFQFPEFTPVPPEFLPALDRCLKVLHLVCGISYFKAAVPLNIQCTTYSLNRAEADFFTWLYRNGLGEFAYRNELSLADLQFPFHDVALQTQIEIPPLPSGVVVPIGGGKDSLVSVGLLQNAGVEFRTFVLGTFPVIDRVIESIGAPSINVIRRISPVLFELNKRGAFNGHVPISAIIASALAVSGIIYGFDTAVLSNERSADEGNLTTAGGVEVNHQFSKSYAFEKAFQNHLTEAVGVPFSYFSLLRPLSELAIGKLFAASQAFDTSFTSCNRAFKVHNPAVSEGLWCCACPKCASTFLCLAPFVERERLIRIFGTNMFADLQLTSLYSRLLGLEGHKPFECVVEYAEARAAFQYLAQQPEWAQDAVVAWTASNDLPAGPSLEQLLAPSGDASIPKPFQEVLHAAL